MDLQFSEFDEARDLDQQRNLFKLSFPEVVGTAQASTEHFHWKFNSYPHTPHSYQYVAFKEGVMVGYYAAIPYRYKISGQTTVCGMVCDVMTHPDYRGHGIFTKIGKFATDALKEKGLDFTSGYPIRPEVIPGHLKVKWKVAGKLPMFIRVLKSDCFLPQKLKFLSVVINPVLSLLNFLASLITQNGNVITLSRAEFFSQPKEIKLFLDQWLSEQENAMVKTIEFLQWRMGAEGITYFFTVLKNKNDVWTGVAISRPADLKGIPTLAILDFMVLNDSLKRAKKIHQEIFKIAKRLGKPAIVSMTSMRLAKHYRFLTNLFLPTPAVFSLILKNVNFNDENALFDLKKWHLFWVDSDDL